MRNSINPLQTLADMTTHHKPSININLIVVFVLFITLRIRCGRSDSIAVVDIRCCRISGGRTVPRGSPLSAFVGTPFNDDTEKISWIWMITGRCNYRGDPRLIVIPNDTIGYRNISSWTASDTRPLR